MFVAEIGGRHVTPYTFFWKPRHSGLLSCRPFSSDENAPDKPTIRDLKAANRRYTEQRRRHVPVLRSFDSFVPPLTRFNDVRQPNDCSYTPAAHQLEIPLCVATKIAALRVAPRRFATPPPPPPTPALPAGGREGGSSFATAPSLLSSTHYVPCTRVTVRQHALYAYVSHTCGKRGWCLFFSLSFPSLLSLSLSLSLFSCQPFSLLLSRTAYTPETPAVYLQPRTGVSPPQHVAS
ncbi:hypothetical protein ALC60_02932 [Trachymyrmex zeteki]|uniref:Uncharacterized protein n=1 Tax=Mycetomoellerius zeteki TaxID=64791 RepID=A0A151XBZ7_9HYME|nr:hypothetical protein ALC60_02932 [Trachymyrmex zeteki]